MKKSILKTTTLALCTALLLTACGKKTEKTGEKASVSSETTTVASEKQETTQSSQAAKADKESVSLND